MTCRTIRAQPHCVTKRAPVNIFPFATAFFIICVPWSGNSTDHAHTHPGQQHSNFLHRTILRPFCPICAQTWSKNRSGPSRDILLLTIYNCILCAHCTPSHLHPPIRPIHGRKNPTFFLFSYLGSFTHKREPCTLQPLHTRTLIHSSSLSYCSPS